MAIRPTSYSACAYNLSVYIPVARCHLLSTIGSPEGCLTCVVG